MEKYSKQREEIINILKESYSHPTAEEVYLLAKEKNPSISRGTVYRNLNFLVEKGEIIKIDMHNGSDRFDYIKDEHSHVICADCGRVIDYHHDFDMDNISKDIKSQTGLEFFSCNIAIKGICDNCKNNNKEE
jgi:Fur family peroxide stress response transcriptional regulator